MTVTFSRDGTGKTRGRGRRQTAASPSQPLPEPATDRVFIWDLDETIIIFHTLLTGAYGGKFNKVSSFSITESLSSFLH